MRPLAQVGRRVEAKGEVDGVCDDHDPALRGCVPDDLRVAELVGVGGDDGVVSVRLEGVATVAAVGYGLLLRTLHATGVLGQGVDCYDTVVLIREETGGVVRVDHGGAGEDEGEVVGCPEGYLLVFPVVEVG